jgi:hypothetical protein
MRKWKREAESASMNEQLEVRVSLRIVRELLDPGVLLH